jgi:hypothetical protein
MPVEAQPAAPICPVEVGTIGSLAFAQSITISCPHCGLSMRLEDGPGGQTLVYDRDDWKRVCKFPGSPSPAWCLAER